MNKFKGKTVKVFISLLLVIFSIFSLAASSFAATDSFEQSIAAFPASYKPYLRKLHQSHPKWKFVPLKTGLDWTKSVDAEQSGDRSLITNHSAYTDIFKSKDNGDYNFSTNTFIEKDSGFVTANKLAVSYYMDPRNFLDEKGIFQFEDLSFNPSFNAAVIESVIKGSFMENTNICYYDEDGKVKKTNEKYSAVIYNAGKTYDINPVFLASKIINEVGKAASKSAMEDDNIIVGNSTSVNGRNKKYPGIYNFYNIGAFDSVTTSPAENGLNWASKGTTYSRPWTTPKKSIMGGAEYIASGYVGAGQHTGYLQKFNVNPNSKYNTYDHQYMTNVAASASIAYSSYQSYKAKGWLDFAFIFEIPVYNNMPASSNDTGTIQAADARNQTAGLTGSSSNYNIRTAATTESSKLDFQFPKGTVVNVLDYCFTAESTPDGINRYPYWGKIQFTRDSKNYTGYVYSNFLGLKTTTNVPKGLYTPLSFKTNKALEYRYVSSNPSIAAIVDDKTINFLKNGTVTITAYDSLGNYDVINYKVSSTADDLAVSGVTVKNVSDTSATVSFKKNDNCNYYEVCAVNANGKLVSSAVTASTSVKIGSLSPEQNYKVYVRGLKQSGTTKNYSVYSAPVSFTTPDPAPPVQVKGFKATAKGYDSVSLTWTKSETVSGYEIYTYNASTKAYKKIGNAAATATAYTDKSANAIAKTSYSIRAYKYVNGKYIYSPYAPIVNYTPPTITVGKVSSLSHSSASSTTVKLQWAKVSGATRYEVYRYSDKDKKYVKEATVTSNSCTVKKLSSNTAYKFKVRALVKVYTKTVYGSYSSVITTYTGPAVVKSVSQSKTTTTGYKISWKAVKGASGYRVYRYNSSSKSYKKLLDTTSTSLTVSKLSAGTVHKYKITPYSKKSGKTYWGTVSSIFTIATTPNAPTSLSQKSTTTTAYTLTWKSVKGASGYKVYKYDSKSKKYKTYKNVTGNSLKITGLSAGKSAKYKVKAYIATSTGNRWGSYSAVYTAITRPATVKSLSQSKTTATSYKLSWKAVSGADGYRVYRYNASSKKYVKFADTTSTSVTVSKLSAGRVDKYKIKAYKKTNGVKFWGDSSVVFTAATTPSKVTGLSQKSTTTTSYTLKWKAVKGATSYRIYRYDSASKSYKTLANVKGATSYKVTGLKKGKSAKYKVKACIATSTGNRWGAESAVYTAKTNK